MRFHPGLGLLLSLLLACGDNSNDDNGSSGHSVLERDGGDAGHSVLDRDGGFSTDGGTAIEAGRDEASFDASTIADGSHPADNAHADGGSRRRDAGDTTPVPRADAAVPDADSLAQRCVDTINMYRATLNLPPYKRSPANEACVDSEAEADSLSGKAHSAFGKCKESAQDECPGWPSEDIAQAVDGCLASMWAEGPGDFNAGHGHYINMSSTKYKSVACGIHDIGNGKFWATQDFFY